METRKGVGSTTPTRPRVSVEGPVIVGGYVRSLAARPTGDVREPPSGR